MRGQGCGGAASSGRGRAGGLAGAGYKRTAVAAAAAVHAAGSHQGDRGSAGRTAGVVSVAAGGPHGDARRGSGARRHGMVAIAGSDADARLFPCRGRSRPAVLAVPRRSVRPRDRATRRRNRAAELVRAWAVRMSGPDGMAYAEIGITTNFSFLRGGSHPQEYVRRASELRLAAIGIADHNTLAGVVRAYKELENPEVEYKPKLLIGSRLVFIDDTPDIMVYPRDRTAYGRLCQLLTRGKRGDDADKTGKGECRLDLDDLLEFAAGQLLVLTLPHRFEPGKTLEILDRLQ